MSTDEITLTLPADRDYYRVAHLVLGGLAVRLNLTFEHLEDLQLALDGVLDRHQPDAEVTVRVNVQGSVIETQVGPFPGDGFSRELEREDAEPVGLRRVLATVVDGVRLDERAGAEWVTLTKRVGTPPEAEG